MSAFSLSLRQVQKHTSYSQRVPQEQSKLVHNGTDLGTPPEYVGSQGMGINTAGPVLGLVANAKGR